MKGPSSTQLMESIFAGGGAIRDVLPETVF